MVERLIGDSPTRSERVADRLFDVLKRQPAGLFTDIDGTISVIAPTPAEAIVEDAAREALRRLAARLSFVGVVTGRSADDGQAMVGLPGVAVVGNHGMERLFGETRWVHPAAATASAALTLALRDVQDALGATDQADGIIFEHKQLTASIHYRLSPDPVVAHELLRRLAEEAAERHQLRTSEGRLVIELRPRLAVDKGTAVTDIAISLGLRGVVYLGDDVTDVDAFRAMTSLRATPEIDAASVAVVSRETHPSVTEAADLHVAGVPGCIALLEELVARFESV